MTLRNEITGAKTKLYMIISTSVAVFSLALSFVPQFIDTPAWFTLSLAGIAAFVLCVILLANHHYIMVDDSQGRIRIRYYTILKLFRKFNAIEIPHGSLVSFEIRRTHLGLRRMLYLKQKVNGQFGMFPPINIGALSANELEKLKSLLSVYVS
ncbi:MAG: hypothetical protein RIS47_313 [Bacteroidota bacterium]